MPSLGREHGLFVTGQHTFTLAMYVSYINSSPTVGHSLKTRTLTATHCTRCTLFALSASDAQTSLSVTVVCCAILVKLQLIRWNTVQI